MPKATSAALQSDCAEFILIAARDLLAEVGYGAMSMRQLASRAGILPGSLYHHVASKQDLLLAVLAHVLEARDSAWQQLPRQKGVLGELRSFIRFMLAWQLTHPTDAKVLEHELRHLDPHQQHWLTRRSNSLQSKLCNLLRRGQRSGTLGDIEVESAALAIMALLGTADGLRNTSTGWSAADLEAHFVKMSWRVLDVHRVGTTALTGH